MTDIALQNLELKQSAARLMLTGAPDLVDRLVLPMLVLDPEGRVVVWNSACERLTGLRAEDVIGTRDHWRAIFAAPSSLLAEALDETGAGGSPPAANDYERVARAAASLHAEQWCTLPQDGARRYLAVDASAIHDAQGKVIAVVETLADQTDRRNSEEMLTLTSSAFETTLEGIVVSDLAGTILHANQAFAAMTGYSLDEIRGQNARLLKSKTHDSEFYRAMWACITSTGHWRGEIWNRKKNGEIYPEILTINAVKDAKGRVSHYIGVHRDITDLKRTQDQLASMTNFDSLTGLPNRGLLSDRLRLSLTTAQDKGKMLGVCFLDIDGFKPINEKYGQDVGNRLLIAVAQRLRGMIRESDLVARFGGDEFILLLSDVKDVEEIRVALNRVLEKIAHPYMIDGREIKISASVGVTFYPGDDADPDVLLRHADQAMYRAKQMGRNRYVIFDMETEAQVSLRQQEIERISQALYGEEFVLFYQPKVKMRTGDVVGAEALIRWMHPEKGMLGPLTFLPQIENTPLTLELGKWVMRRALRQIREWQAQGVTLKISVNISASHIQEPNFVTDVREALAQFPDVSPTLLELEILESSAFDDIDMMHKVITDCQNLGVTFALDDFGTGYSTLTYLKRLPSNLLKIDQSFVRNMLNSKQDLAIIKGVVGLASAFGMDVIAEGVETDEHGVMLLDMGCELAQGFGVARPMPPEKVIAWMAAFKPSELWATHES